MFPHAPNQMLCNAMFFIPDDARELENLSALALDSGGPAGKVSSQRSEGVGAILVLDELALGLASALVDVDNRVAVVEVTPSLGGDLEAGGGGLADDSVVLLEAASESVGEVVAGGTLDRSVRVRNVTLHAAGDERNARSLNHGDGGQDSESSGGELHIGGWFV